MIIDSHCSFVDTKSRHCISDDTSIHSGDIAIEGSSLSLYGYSMSSNMNTRDVKRRDMHGMVDFRFVLAWLVLMPSKR